MTNQNRTQSPDKATGSAKPSSLGLRIRRAAQLASRAKAQASANAARTASHPAADGVAPAVSVRGRKSNKTPGTGPRSRSAAEPANVFQPGAALNQNFQLNTSRTPAPPGAIH